MAQGPGPAVVFGLSTEGYLIASALARNQVPTTVIDENLQMGTELKPDVASHHPSVTELLEAEPLLGLAPLGGSLERARLVFFVPKVRKTGEDARAEIASRLRGVVKAMSKGSTLVYCIPAGFGENVGNAALAEKLSGLKIGEELSYVYAPLMPCSSKPFALGATKAKAGKEVLEALQMAGIKGTGLLSLEASELLHARQVLARCVTAATELDLYRKVEDIEQRTSLRRLPGYRDVYLDDLSPFLFDMRALAATLEPGDPLLYLTTGMLKGVDGYIKYLVEQIRSLLRRRDLKASKTRVFLIWSLDRYEMRGDRQAALSSILERMRDYVGDVVFVNAREARGAGELLTSTDKMGVLVAFSESDYEVASKSISAKRGAPDTILIKANLLVEQAAG